MDKDGNICLLLNVWDADSNRVEFSANGTEYELVYDTTAGIPAVIEESTSGSTAYYVREPGGSLIARLNATEGIRYYHFDELGSTRLLTDADGDITDKYAYDAYGSLLSHDCYSGSVSQPYQYVGQLGYYTHWMEPDFGLLQLGVRFYDPEVGRFTSRDPAREGVSHYGYVGNSPLQAVDSWGLKRTDVSNDDVLVRCLDGIRSCLCKAYANAIDSVREWVTDDDDPSADAYTGWKRHRGSLCGMLNHYEPNIVFNPKGLSWSRRNRSPAAAHEFCKTVLHELTHVVHGMLGSCWDNFKERCVDRDCVQKTAEDLYSDNFKCIDKALRKPKGPIFGH
ncbi:MAG: RHS repeat domain-containing protein [Armatimonadota bacterium]